MAVAITPFTTPNKIGKKRPLRTLAIIFLTKWNEITVKKLDSGVDMVHYIEKHPELDLSKINDIVIGYDLIQNPDSRLFRLEPSWFAITGNTSKRIPTEWIRGDEYGLE